MILCEDTRVAKRLIYLLNQKSLLAPKEYRYIALHSHNEADFLAEVEPAFFEQAVVYMSDAGMPCISDPGAGLVRYMQAHGLPYTVLPGANALLTLFAASGSENRDFFFYGFLPHKPKEREAEWLRLLAMDCDVIFYESPHRIMEFFSELERIAPTRELFAAKELTKIHERFYKGSARDIQDRLKQESTKGEWAILLYRGAKQEEAILTLGDLASLEIPPKVRAKILAKMTGKSVEECYKAGLDKG